MFSEKAGEGDALFSFVEEALLSMDFIPSFTLTWIYAYITRKDSKFANLDTVLGKISRAKTNKFSFIPVCFSLNRGFYLSESIIFVFMEQFLHLNLIEAGCDEAGRGCLAGAVYAAAVILPKDFPFSELKDSKKMSETKRNKFRQIIEKYAVWAVAIATAEEIDELNVLRASIIAMHRAIAELCQEPEHLLIDGNRFYPYEKIPHSCIVKGDAKYATIAAASILAKTHRDAYMKGVHEKYPQYGWDCNKGYPTATHKEAIAKYGITPLHRKSFTLLEKQREIIF